MNQGGKLWAGIAVITAILALVGLTMFGGDVERNHSVEWCEDQGGNVSMSNSIGNHGGWHCTLPNGTTKHVYLTEKTT